VLSVRMGKVSCEPVLYPFHFSMCASRGSTRSRCSFAWNCFGLMALLIPHLCWADSKALVYRNTAPGVAYTGSGICSGCHKEIYDGYSLTGMGRSMSRAGEAAQRGLAPSPTTIFDKGLNRYFQVFSDVSGLLQSEYELDAAGQDVFRNTQRIEYVVGSGANGHSYIVRRGDYLFQAPLSFYSKPQKWGLSPGYEFSDYGFSRPIQPGCIVCHSGQPQPVAQRGGLYKNPPFFELSVGCENCHGPGQLHVEGRAKGLRTARGQDTSIVNPARLPGWLADNICMNCHQGGATRVLQPGKDYLDFRPGTPLNDTVAIFRLPFDRESAPDEDLLEHYSSMTFSKCFRESSGRLSCLSCHNPHFEPAVADAAAYYRGKCLACHTDQSCVLPIQQRLSKEPANDCAGCHMPKRRVTVIAHSALTQHRIPARDGQPFPHEAFRQGSRSLPDLIHLNPVPGQEEAELPPLTLLQAYGELLTAHPKFRDRYLSMLDRLAEAEPNNPLVLSALSRRAKLQGSSGQALQYLKRAIELGSANPSDFQDMAELLSNDGRVAEAIVVLKKGVTLSPYTAALYKSLALNYIKLKRYQEALQTMKQELELFPEDSFMRKLIKQVEGTNQSEAR
jgi:hypothetical protein